MKITKKINVFYICEEKYSKNKFDYESAKWKKLKKNTTNRSSNEVIHTEAIRGLRAEENPVRVFTNIVFYPAS